MRNSPHLGVPAAEEGETTPTVVPADLSPARPAMHALDRSLVLGLAWTSATKWLTQFLSWAATLFLARILTPGDYGLVGMAMVYLGFIIVVNEFGLTSAIVQQRDLDGVRLARLGGLALASGLFWCVLSGLLAQPIARFFGEPAVATIIMVLSLGFIAEAAQIVPRALLARELRFQTLAAIEAVAAVALTAGALALALLGFGYRSLVFAMLLSRFIGMTALVLARPHPVAWPRELRSLAGTVRFGGHVLVGKLAWYSYTEADFAVVGRVLGKVALGTYTIGWTLASVPIERIAALMGQVTPGIFSAVQHDRPAVRRYFGALTEGLAFLTFPASVGLALTSEAFVLVVLGEQWRGAITPLFLLALYASFRSVDTLPYTVLLALGHAKRSMHFSLLILAVMLPLFYAGTRWGTTGVALAWLVGYPLASLPMYRFLFRSIDMSAADYLRALRPAAGATAVMAVAVLLLRVLTPDAWPLWLRFALEVTAGVGSYALAVWSLHRQRVLRFLELLRQVRS